VTSQPDITLYAAIASRAFTARWMLEELGVPYRTKNLSLRKGQQKSPDFLRINPMGKVPALTDGDVVVTENVAIGLYLADRYGYGTLAPRVDDAARGPYLRWSVFATSVFEPGVYQTETITDTDAMARGWGHTGAMRAVVEGAVTPGPYLLGERFSGADVILGSLISFALFNRLLPATPGLAAYDARLTARPAYKRAAEANWPPALFGDS
jgi:glutathione S-transferase